MARQRPNRPAAQRRQQYDRAHARVAETLIKGLMSLNHRGCRRTKLGEALLHLLSSEAAQPEHGAEEPLLFAASQPWPWQWQWPQAEVPWPEQPAWHREQFLPEEPAASPLAATKAGDLGPAAEDPVSNWSNSCSVAPDGRFGPLSSSSSTDHENTAAPTPTPSPTLANGGDTLGKAEEEREGPASSAALPTEVEVPPDGPSTASSLAKDSQPQPKRLFSLRDAHTAEEVSRFRVDTEKLQAALSDKLALVAGQPGNERLSDNLRLQLEGVKVALADVAEKEEKFRRREAREARRQAALLCDDRPVAPTSAGSLEAG